MLGLKHKNGLDTDHWTAISEKSNSDGQFLVINIDEDFLQKLKALKMCPFLGCKRVPSRCKEGKNLLIRR